MAAPGRCNGMARLQMQAWSWRRMEKKREVFGGEGRGMRKG